MLIRLFSFVILVSFFSPGILFSATNKKVNYLINPTIQNFDSFPNFNTNMRWFINPVQNQSLTTDSNIIGYTRTGIKTTAPIICSPSLAVAVENSFKKLLAVKKGYCTDLKNASYIVNISILYFSLLEKSSFLTQTMSSKIKLEIKLTDPTNPNRIRKFTVETENAQTALDTSKYAESIVRSVLNGALKEAWKTINQ